jgi:hypothetical protein
MDCWLNKRNDLKWKCKDLKLKLKCWTLTLDKKNNMKFDVMEASFVAKVKLQAMHKDTNGNCRQRGH